MSGAGPHETGLELVGGAFSPWKNPDPSDPSKASAGVDEESYKMAVDAAAAVLANDRYGVPGVASSTPPRAAVVSDDGAVVIWLAGVLGTMHGLVSDLPGMLKNGDHLSKLCQHTVTKLNAIIDLNVSAETEDVVSLGDTAIEPFAVANAEGAGSINAANFISFLHRVGVLSGIESPYGSENPFLQALIESRSISPGRARTVRATAEFMNEIFDRDERAPLKIAKFFRDVCQTCDDKVAKEARAVERYSVEPPATKDQPSVTMSSSPRPVQQPVTSPQETVPQPLMKYHRPPEASPSPFETAIWSNPGLVVIFLSFLGDPVAVCRMKMVNKFSNRVLNENEHTVMRDAVRLGGISPHIRPAFWMWITLEKCKSPSSSPPAPSDKAGLDELEQRGREGKWHGVIARDVARAFGNMPPHKTGALLRADSIVRALVYWGRGRLMKRGVKGGGVGHPIPTIASFDGQRPKPRAHQSTSPPPWETGDESSQNTEDKQAQTDKVSDWGGVSPVPSFTGSLGENDMDKRKSPAAIGTTPGTATTTATTESTSQLSQNKLHPSIEEQPASLPVDGHNESTEAEKTEPNQSPDVEELALSGNALTNEMKLDLQNQLGFILHCLAAVHEDVGYCQGMDYIVAHLLRVLQETVRWQAVNSTLPKSVSSFGDEDTGTAFLDDSAIDQSRIVEGVVFSVMNSFMTNYNLRHMFWPELRCLKTCCRVFEKIIQLKLPVLADHFDHHELNVGLFALGWFQTLFLYLPSMPSATVCHIWDIWLVERSFKIFFRVGTAILFLSQPILLNHDLEGMMTYLNTFPDATLLNPDILIACALQIKITNVMLEEIEKEVATHNLSY